MEEQCSPLSWTYYYQEEGLEELKHSLLYSTLELEAALLSAHEEISRKDDEILQLKGLLAKIIKERDEFQAQCQELVVEKQVLLQQVQIQAHPSKKHLDCPISSGTTSNEECDNPSDCDDSSINAAASPGCKDTLPLPGTVLPPAAPVLDVIDRIALGRSLPQPGKFLQSVMDAGPLLQTLLLAGPLPQWQHPPPQLNSIDIPPVTISSPTAKVLHQEPCLISPSSGGFTNKRPLANREGSEFSPKYQKVCSPIMINPPPTL